MKAVIQKIDINEVTNTIRYLLKTDNGLTSYFKAYNRADKSLKVGDIVTYTVYSNLYSDSIDSIRK